MRPQLRAAPATERALVQQHLAAHLGPDADHHPRQRGLARARRPHHHRHRAGLRLQVHVFEDRRLAPCSAGRHIPQGQGTCRGHAGQGGIALGVVAQQGFKAPESGLGTNERTPHPHQRINGRQSASSQHIGRDHRARRQLPVDHQQSACAQRERLLAIAQKLAPRHDAVGEALRRALLVHGVCVALGPAAAQTAQHAHRLHHLGIAQLALHVQGHIALSLGRHLRRLHRAAVAEPGQQRLQNRKHNRHPTQERVQKEQHRDIHRRPGGVKKGEHPVARQKLTDLRQV